MPHSCDLKVLDGVGTLPQHPHFEVQKPQLQRDKPGLVALLRPRIQQLLLANPNQHHLERVRGLDLIHLNLQILFAEPTLLQCLQIELLLVDRIDLDLALADLILSIWHHLLQC